MFLAMIEICPVSVYLICKDSFRIMSVALVEVFYGRNKHFAFVVCIKGYFLNPSKTVFNTQIKLGSNMTSSPWVRMSNDGIKVSAISAFSSQMIYAATVQIKELEDYYLVKPVMETL